MDKGCRMEDVASWAVVDVPMQTIKGLSHKRQKSLPQTQTVSTYGCIPREEWAVALLHGNVGHAGEVFSRRVSQVSHIS